ncbi:MAG: hypothetical protein ABI091_30935 [Ferruginibacter sp.]
MALLSVVHHKNFIGKQSYSHPDIHRDGFFYVCYQPHTNGHHRCVTPLYSKPLLNNSIRLV